MMERLDLNPASVSKVAAPVSHGVSVKANRLIFTSGQVATDEEGKIVGKGDAAKQMDQIMTNIGSILKEAGCDFSSVIKVNMYLVDMKDLSSVIAVRSKYLGDNKVTATAIEVKALANPDFKVEVEVIAICD